MSGRATFELIQTLPDIGAVAAFAGENGEYILYYVYNSAAMADDCTSWSVPPTYPLGQLHQEWQEVNWLENHGDKTQQHNGYRSG
jgi:hypothetical protein